MSSKVSLLVPIYGVEQYIERCARSLFEQTYPNLEFVFVNDCTPDRSIEVLKKVMEDYSERKGAVRIVDHEKNKGIAAARNTGLDNVSGEFVVMVDSDDWLELNAIELMVKRQKVSDVDLVLGNLIVHYQNEDSLLEERKYQSREKMVLQMMQRSWDHHVTGRLIRRSLFVDNGLRWNEGLDLAEDRYMMTLLAYHAKGYDTVDNVVYHYERQNIGSITMNSNGEKTLRNNRQELGNVLLLEQFFKDKETVYQKECVKCVMKQLECNLRTTLVLFSKDEFYEVVSDIDGRSYNDWEIIGWKKTGIKGWLMHNYRCMRLNLLKERTVRFVKKMLK